MLATRVAPQIFPEAAVCWSLQGYTGMKYNQAQLEIPRGLCFVCPCKLFGAGLLNGVQADAASPPLYATLLLTLVTGLS